MFRRLKKLFKKSTAKPNTQFSLLKMFEDLSDSGMVSADFLNAVVMISNDVYEEYLCNGKFTPVDDGKTHAFFRGARMWITFRRGVWVGDVERQLPNGKALKELDSNELEEYGLPGIEDVEKMCSPLVDEDYINFGIQKDSGETYIVGRENKIEILMSPVRSENYHSEEE